VRNSTGFVRRVARLFERPLFGTQSRYVERVDPDAYPEEEFPIWCLECSYPLTRLPESRCPECGEAFDRGEVLVTTYTGNFGLSPDDRRRRRRLHLAITGVSSFGMPIFILLGAKVAGMLGLGQVGLKRLFLAWLGFCLVIVCTSDFILTGMGPRRRKIRAIQRAARRPRP
jgi:hypothetical protein